MHSHHAHEVSKLASERIRALRISLLIIVVIMVVELVGGILSNSLSLIGDAGHMLVDALALALSLIAITLARRPATSTKTFGFHRMEIMAALANGVTLVLIAAYIFYEAYERFSDPPEVQPGLMLGVAVIGLIANIAGIWLLKDVRHGSLNVRAAFLHIFGDTISSVGVIVAAIVISLTGWVVIDPIIAVFIGCIILLGAVRLVRESSDILLEAVPAHIQMDRVIEVLKTVPGVDETHDIHVWTITSGLYALSAHLVIADQSVSRSADIVKAVNTRLAEQFSIRHTTLQLECESCPSGVFCEMNLPRDIHE
ncbi:MAG: cation transporter [Chloroflexi bacterium]|nr:cation transporter [Chloroflexota bacterium]